MKFCVVFSVLLFSSVIKADTTTIDTTTVTTTTVTTTTRTPAPRPDGGSWNVTDKNNVCILFDAGIRLELALRGVLDVPKNATANGSCDLSNQEIELAFLDVTGNLNWILKFNFTKVLNGTKYSLSHFSLSNDGQGTAKINVTGQLMDGAFPSEDFDRSYVCSKMQSIYVGPVNGSDSLLSIKTVAVKFEAFRNSTTSVFSAADTCTADDVSQLVPIIVGAALAGLIVIVLIAYLIGRKRSQRGYESV